MQILKKSVLEISMTGGETETGIALAEKAMPVSHFFVVSRAPKRAEGFIK